MPEKIAYRQRIIDRMVAIMSAGVVAWVAEDLAAKRITVAQHDAANAVGAEAWDARGNAQVPFTVVVSSGATATEREAIGNPPTDNHTLVVEVEAMLAQRRRADASDPNADAINESSEAVHSRWQARMLDTVRANKFLTEPDTGHHLCPLGVRMVGASDAPGDSDLIFYAVLTFEVEHDTFELDPYAGPSVPEKEV